VHFTPDPEPALVPASEEPFRAIEHFSLEDPRITQIDDTYYITYFAYSEHGCVTGLACTRDFERYERVAVMALPDNKNVVLFPEKIGGRYAKLDRPMIRPPSVGDIWISFSPDLAHWGDPRPVMQTRPRKWDNYKIGAGAPPHQDASRLAGDLPRRAPDRGGLAVPPGSGASAPGGALAGGGACQRGYPFAHRAGGLPGQREQRHLHLRGHLGRRR
jgi:hypothetical protein